MHDLANAVERFASPLTYNAGEKEGAFDGLASVFGSTAVGARGPTRFARGAFAETLAKTGGKIPLLWQHDQSRPVGVISALRETDRGLEISGKITTNTFGKDILDLMRDGAVSGLSIGFDAVTHKFEKQSSGEQIRIVTKANLHETSLVTFPADPNARVMTVHSAEQHGITVSDVWDAEQFEYLMSMLDVLIIEKNEGRALSTRNKTRLRDGATALLALLADYDKEWVKETVGVLTADPERPATPIYPGNGEPPKVPMGGDVATLSCVIEAELLAAELAMMEIAG